LHGGFLDNGVLFRLFYIVENFTFWAMQILKSQVSTHASQRRYRSTVTGIRNKLSGEKHSRLQGIVDRVEQRLYGLGIGEQNLAGLLREIKIYEGLISKYGSTESSKSQPMTEVKTPQTTPPLLDPTRTRGGSEIFKPSQGTNSKE
jgi:hypothetical protein